MKVLIDTEKNYMLMLPIDSPDAESFQEFINNHKETMGFENHKKMFYNLLQSWVDEEYESIKEYKYFLSIYEYKVEKKLEDKLIKELDIEITEESTQALKVIMDKLIADNVNQPTNVFKYEYIFDEDYMSFYDILTDEVVGAIETDIGRVLIVEV